VLDEKIGQLWQTGLDRIRTKYWPISAQRRVGSFLAAADSSKRRDAQQNWQHIVVEQSRLGIPLIFGHERHPWFRTIFPIPLGLSCAWEPGLLEKSQTVAAREASAAGIDWAFAPMVDLARDPRWAASWKVLARIRGSARSTPQRACADFRESRQADRRHQPRCRLPETLCRLRRGGRRARLQTTEISEFTLRKFYLPPYKAGVDAGAWTVMSAFNCLTASPLGQLPHAYGNITQRVEVSRLRRQRLGCGQGIV